MMRTTFVIKLNCSSALMQQRTVVCSAVIYQKSTDFSNDFVRQMEITNKVYFVLMAYLLFYCSKLSDNNLRDMYSARRC